MSENKKIYGGPIEKKFFSSEENAPLYKKLRKEYKKINFLIKNSNSLGLKDNCISTIKKRQHEIDILISGWPQDLQDRFVREISDIPTFMKSLPGSYNYEEIKVPSFDEKKTEKKFWTDFIDWSFFPFASNAQDDKRSDAITQAEEYNKRVESDFQRARSDWQKQLKVQSPKREQRYSKYRLFINKVKAGDGEYIEQMPGCYMKDVLQYLYELLKSQDIQDALGEEARG